MASSAKWSETAVNKNWNDFCHLNPETLKFVGILRDANKIKDGGEEIKRLVLTTEQLALVDNGRKKGLTEVKAKCRDPDCLDTEERMAIVLQQRFELLKLIDQKKVIVNDNEDFNKEFSERLAELTNEHVILDNTFNEASKKFLEKKQKLKDNSDTYRTLCIEISRIQKEIQNRTSDEENKQNANKKKQTSPLYEHMSIIKGQKRLNLRHSGRFTFAEDGKKVWSCCFQCEEDAPGCTEVVLTSSEPPKSLLVNNHYQYYSTNTQSSSTNSSSNIASAHRPASSGLTSRVVSTTNLANKMSSASILSTSNKSTIENSSNNNDNDNRKNKNKNSSISDNYSSADININSNSQRVSTAPMSRRPNKLKTSLDISRLANSNKINNNVTFSSAEYNDSMVNKSTTADQASSNVLHESSFFTSLILKNMINNNLNRGDSINDNLRPATSSTPARSKTKISAAELLNYSNNFLTNFHAPHHQLNKLGSVRLATKKVNDLDSEEMDGRVLKQYMEEVSEFRKKPLCTNQGPHLLNFPHKGTPST